MTITMSLGKVLLVDDDPATLELVKLALRDYRLDFDIAKEGLSALDLIRSKKYGLLICDYRLPNVHGLDLIKAAKQQNPICQILLMSASTASTIDSNLDAVSLLGFIQKPFLSVQLREMVAKVF